MPAIPMRTDELVDQRPSRVDAVTKGVLMPTSPPEPHRGWHPIVKRLWAAFSESGQVHWWQQSDWAFAESVCDDLSRFKKQEDAYMRAVRRAEKWDREAGSLSKEERRNQGLAETRPHVPRPGSTGKIEAIYSALERLMVTEADRRRVRIELGEPVEVEDDPVAEVVEMQMRALGVAE